MALTPNNRTRLVFKDPQTTAEAWITPTQYPNLVEITSNFSSGFTENLILQACRRINRICNRYFNQQEADEIIINDDKFWDGYITYVLKNSPIVTITDIYLQTANTFQQIEPEYNQVFTEERTIKILPNVLQSISSVTVLNLQRGDFKPLNLWLRYTSGFEIDRTDPLNVVNDVPEDIQYATALMASYLASQQQNLSGVLEFKTQTYAEKKAKPSENPLLLEIQEIIKPYKLYSVK